MKKFLVSLMTAALMFSAVPAFAQAPTQQPNTAPPSVQQPECIPLTELEAFFTFTPVGIAVFAVTQFDGNLPGPYVPEVVIILTRPDWAEQAMAYLQEKTAGSGIVYSIAIHVLNVLPNQ